MKELTHFMPLVSFQRVQKETSGLKGLNIKFLFRDCINLKEFRCNIVVDIFSFDPLGSFVQLVIFQLVLSLLLVPNFVTSGLRLHETFQDLSFVRFVYWLSQQKIFVTSSVEYPAGIYFEFLGPLSRRKPELKTLL